MTGAKKPTRNRVGTLLVLLPLGAALWGLAPSLAWLAICAAGVVAFVRTAVVYRPATPRGVALELALSTSALWLAGVLASPRPGAAALALWSWFLIQSAYFLLRGRPITKRGSDPRDPFDRACGQLSRILAEEPLL